MAGSKTCSKCGGRMSEGRTLTSDSNGSHKAARWIEGVLERSWLTGLKIKGARILPIVTWRCTRCGLLEDYAEG